MSIKILLLLVLLVPNVALAQTGEPPTNAQRSIIETSDLKSSAPTAASTDRNYGTSMAAILLIAIAGYATWTLVKQKTSKK